MGAASVVPAYFVTIRVPADPSPGSPARAGSPPFPQGGEGIVKSYSQCDQNHELALHRLTMIPKSGLKRSVSTEA